ncbi:unnamed protein product [Peniophora sp. CBMAI 1063]|nr:unnamed protein product [Peniophora sp. CBMAI 1063]
MSRPERLRTRTPSKSDSALPFIVIITTVSVALSTIFVLFAACTGRLSTTRSFAIGRLRESELRALSFEDDEVPIFYPMLDLPVDAEVDQRPLVKVGFEETVHFHWDNSTSAREYFQMIPFGSVGQRHGKQNRAFATAVFHMEHCYRIFHSVYVSDDIPGIQWEHINHCVNYLRQQILCTADLTPEMGDFMARDPGEAREGSVRVCRDFGAMYDSAAYNWFSWLRYAKAHNITIPAK